MIRMKSKTNQHQKPLMKSTKFISTMEAAQIDGDVLNADSRSTQRQWCKGNQ